MKTELENLCDELSSDYFSDEVIVFQISGLKKEIGKLKNTLIAIEKGNSIQAIPALQERLSVLESALFWWEVARMVNTTEVA
jgi:hypothetical protein